MENDPMPDTPHHIPRFSQWLAALILGGVAALVAADTPANESEAVNSLVEALSPLTALQGEFHQQQRDREGTLLMESRGDFLMQRPGLLRWQTHEPYPQLLVTDGERIWLYDPDLEQVSIRPVSEEIDHTPAILFSGDLSRIQERFHVQRTGAGRYSLKPRTGDASFRQLQIEFDDQLLSRMVVLDGLGQTTVFQLSNVERLSPQPLEQFRFQPPPGTDVMNHD